MSDVHIQMFGQFTFTVNGEDALRFLGNSRKSRTVLTYLILYGNRPVPSALLYHALWPVETSANPENALKTLISRMRAALSQVDRRLGDCILTLHGGYQWNMSLAGKWVDIYELEPLCDAIEGATALTPETVAACHRMMEVYGGRLLNGLATESWISARESYYHARYLSAVMKMVQLNKMAGNPAEVERLCRRALEVDSFDENLNLERMEALERLRKREEEPPASGEGQPPAEAAVSEQARALFRRHQWELEQAIHSDMDAIRNNLQSTEEQRGAFVCEYEVLKEIYQLMARNLRRLNIPICLSIVMLTPADDADPVPAELDQRMNQLLGVMVSSLRRSDTVARYSSVQYVVILPALSEENGGKVMERIRRTFYAIQSAPQYEMRYRLAPLLEEGSEEG